MKVRMEEERKKKKSRKKQIGIPCGMNICKMLGSIGRSENPKKDFSK